MILEVGNVFAYLGDDDNEGHIAYKVTAHMRKWIADNDLARLATSYQRQEWQGARFQRFRMTERHHAMFLLMFNTHEKNGGKKKDA